MKQRILLSLIFILTTVMSWGQWSDGDEFTDSNYPGLTFKIVSANNKSARVIAVDVTATTGGTDVVIPGTVTGTTKAGSETKFTVGYSGTGIYSGCTSVTLGENIHTIDNGAFMSCPNLTQVNLPSTLKTWKDFQVHQVGDQTTIKLAKFTFPNGTTNPNDSKKYFSLNSDGNALMSADGTILYCILSNKLDGTTVKPLTTINVPDGVEYFAGGGSRTFGHNCDGVKSGNQSSSENQVHTINLPASFKGVISSTGTTSTVMDVSTFSIIHNSLTAINVVSENAVYANNSNDGILYTQDLTTLIALPGAKYYGITYTVADEVTTIAANAAYHADETTLDLNNVVSVGDNAFSLNDLLTTVNIGDDLTTLSSSTFADCGNLSAITVNEGNPKYAGDGVLYGPGETDEEIAAAKSDAKLKWKHLMTCPGKKTGEYTVETDAQIIDEKAFKGSALTTVNLSNVTTIGEYAFSQSAITTLDIPNTVTSVGNYAFYQCRSLKTATVGTGLTEISDHMFAAAFKSTKKSDNSLTFASPSKITTIKQQAFGSINLLSITIPKSVTSMETLVFQKSSITAVTFEDGSLLNSISGTFRESKVETVDFGKDSHLVKIGASSFDGVTTLKEIKNFPETVTEIGNRAFALCTGLTHFPFANGGNLKTIGVNAFQGCSVTDFNLPEGLETIGSEAFRECASLKTLEIPSTVKSIGLLFTESCDALTKINVSRSNATYSSSDGILCSKDKETLIVFPGGKDLNTFTLLPPSITTIKQYAFYGCTGLKYIVLPKKLATIENFAFECCDNLKTITFLGDAKPANVDAAVEANNTEAQTKKDAGDTTWQNYADHRFGNATTSAVDFLKTVTVNIRHASDTQTSFAGSYWANANKTVVSFDATSGTKPDGNSFEYIFMSPDTLGIVKSNSTNYTAVVPASVVWPTSGKNYDDTDITGGDGNTYAVGLVADYAFEDMPTSVNEVVFLGPIKYVGANAFNDGHNGTDGAQVTSPTSNIQNIFFTSNSTKDDNKMELSSVKFELNGMSLADETNNYDWGTENYAEFLKMGSYTTSNTKVTAKPVTVTKTQNVYVPKSRIAAVQTLWSNKAEDGTASGSATNAATVADYKIPLPQINTTYGTISREFDVDLAEPHTENLTIDKMPIVAFTGKVKDFTDASNNVIGIRMLSINCTKSGSIQTGQTNLGDGTYIPANTGVLLKAFADDGKSASGTYYRIGEKDHDYPEYTAPTTDVLDNVFQPVVENSLKIDYTDAGHTFYNYLISNGGYKSVNTSGNTMSVHKSYIHLTSNIGAAKAPTLQFIWDDEDDNATAIKTVDSSENDVDKVIYDISGRRINAINVKGLYIVNGKKMYVK